MGRVAAILADLAGKTCLIIALICAGTLYAAEPLPKAEAFKLSVIANAGHEISVTWSIKPNYYLYAEKLHFKLIPEEPYTVKLPASESKQDPVLGTVEVYSGDFTIPLQVKTQQDNVKLEVSYQGCSREGFCYPPTKEYFDIKFDQAFGNDTLQNKVVSGQSISALVTDQNRVQSLFAQDNRGVMLFIFFGIGILLAFTPCVLPMVPILTGIIAGQSKSATSLKVFMLSVCYVMGMSITYALAGVMTAYAGGSIQVILQQPLVIIASSLLFIILGFSLFEFFDLPISSRWHNAVMRWSARHEGGTFVGVFFMGVFSTLIVSPCVTAPLVGVLLYISRTGDALLGGTALFTMGLGMGVPLILVGISAGRLLPKSGKWMLAVTKLFGLMMFGMAIWLLGRILTPQIMMILWSLYTLGVALFCGLYLMRLLGHDKLILRVILITLLAGILMIATTIGLPLLPFNQLNDSSIKVEANSDFAVVRSIASLQTTLAEAKAAGKPVLVDFYADWCTSCVEMDTKVFADQKVQAILNSFLLVRVDLSNNTADDQALLKEYSVIAPPTVLFFNASGKEVDSRRIIGEVSTKEFLNRIQLFLSENCNAKAHC
jgi:thioredoxin:protein disulfide reductase